MLDDLDDVGPVDAVLTVLVLGTMFAVARVLDWLDRFRRTRPGSG